MKVKEEKTHLNDNDLLFSSAYSTTRTGGGHKDTPKYIAKPNIQSKQTPHHNKQPSSLFTSF